MVKESPVPGGMTVRASVPKVGVQPQKLSPRPLAVHVQAALTATAQPKRAVAPTAPARHVQAALAATAQPKRAAALPPAPAAHVQTALTAAAQMKRAVVPPPSAIRGVAQPALRASEKPFSAQAAKLPTVAPVAPQNACVQAAFEDYTPTSSELNERESKVSPMSFSSRVVRNSTDLVEKLQVGGRDL